MVFIDQSGDVKPSYSGINAPRYPHGGKRDMDVPHDMYGNADVEGAVASTTKSDAIEGDLRPAYLDEYAAVSPQERDAGRIGVAGARGALESIDPPKL